MVFDGYSPSTKDHEHCRRTKNASSDIVIRPNMTHWTSRVKFLTNMHNKSQLIEILTTTFEKNDIFVEQSKYDAGCLVVKEASSSASQNIVQVIYS